MIVISTKTTIAYSWLKSEIYIKKVAVMKNNTLALTSDFVNINPTIYTIIHLRKLVGNICCPHQKLLPCYKVLAFSSEVNHHPN